MKHDTARNELTHVVVNRRNYLVAVWVGRTLGLDGDALTALACRLTQRAGASATGILPIAIDELEAHGVHVTPVMVRLELQRAEDRARAELVSVTGRLGAA